MQMNSIEAKAKTFHALGAPSRLRILSFLLKKKEPICICHIAKYLGKDQSVAFRHIQILKDVGLVSTEKRGLFLFCGIADENKIKKLIGEDI
jgi:DNA-binding transcriptional ArsR family regulator